jgi:hypothetical protein
MPIGFALFLENINSNSMWLYSYEGLLQIKGRVGSGVSGISDGKRYVVIALPPARRGFN